MISFDWTTRWGYLVLPSLAIFGFLTNLINIIVLLNPKMKDISFKYLLAISISDLSYLFLCSYAFVYICPDCPLGNTYFTQIAVIYSSNYLTSVLAIFNIFLAIYLSLIRYSILKNKKYFQSINIYLVIASLFFISLIYYSPVLFFSEIVPIIQQDINNNITVIENNNDYIEYKVIKTSVGASLYGKVTPIILSVIRLILAILIETSINIMNVIEFRKRYSNRFLRRPTEIGNIF
jgi:hypothetical protein